MMQAGKKDQWIRFVSESIGRDSFGGSVRSWALVVETWAASKTVSGQQSDKSGKVTHESSREFRIGRQDMPITESMRIILNGSNWRIQSIDDGMRSGEIRIIASADK